MIPKRTLHSSTFLLSSGSNYWLNQSLCRSSLISLNNCHYNMALSCPSSPQQSHLESPSSPFSPLKICLPCPSHANQPQARVEVFKYIKMKLKCIEMSSSAACKPNHSDCCAFMRRCIFFCSPVQILTVKHLHLTYLSDFHYTSLHCLLTALSQLIVYHTVPSKDLWNTDTNVRINIVLLIIMILMI